MTEARPYSPEDDEDGIVADEMGFFDEEMDFAPEDDDVHRKQAAEQEEPPMDVEEEFEREQQQSGKEDESVSEDRSVPGSTAQGYQCDGDVTTPTAVRHEYSRKRLSSQKELFQFEQYRQGGNWRDPDATRSPGTMAASSWKARKKPIIDWGHTITKRSSKLVSAAPDVQILTFLKKDYANLIRKTKMTTKSTVGKKSVPITLADQSRHYVPMSSRQSAFVESKSNKVYHPLGVSFSTIMNKVKQRRRAGEREKVQLEATSPTSVTTMAAVNSQLWVDKHAPSSFSHLLSNERCNREVVRALREWDPHVFGRAPPKRPAYFQAQTDNEDKKDPASTNPNDKRPDETSRVILLSGPPGVGKTTLAHIAAAHVGYRPVEVNGSDERSEGALKQRVLRAMESTLTFNGKAKPNCIILDEIDGADAVNAIQALVKIIREPIPRKNAKAKVEYLRRPIIMICNNRYASTLKPLLPYAKHFAVSPPVDTRLVARLNQIITSENLSVMAGSSLLGQLATTACGDIRSCLHTLQFASTKAREMAEMDVDVVDISHELKSILNGEDLKDQKSDIASTVSAIFRKEKNSSGKSITALLNIVERFNDTPRVLDILLTNILQIPYIDPTLDRCAAVYEHLSFGDVLRHRRLHHQMLPICGIVHLLCSVERRQDISFNSKLFTETAFRFETNAALLRKFKDGMVLKQSLSCRSSDGVARETVPYLFWILSAGVGNGSLTRGTTSENLLKNKERRSFERHVSIMAALGLKYRPEEDDNTNHTGSLHHRIEPPIDNLSFDAELTGRVEVPPALKELITAKVKQCVVSTSTAIEDKVVTNEASKKLTASAPPKKREKPYSTPMTDSIENVPSKRRKTTDVKQNFLAIGAKKAKAARHKRNAARVGAQRTRQEKLSHTGSGKLLSEVVRLKFVKGFTQAVKIPCRMEDL